MGQTCTVSSDSHLTYKIIMQLKHHVEKINRKMKTLMASKSVMHINWGLQIETQSITAIIKIALSQTYALAYFITIIVYETNNQIDPNALSYSGLPCICTTVQSKCSTLDSIFLDLTGPNLNWVTNKSTNTYLSSCGQKVVKVSYVTSRLIIPPFWARKTWR